MRILAVLAVLYANSAFAHSIDLLGTFAPEAIGASGTGSLFLQYDEHGHTLFVDVEWSGLSSGTTVAQIHCCTSAPSTGTADIALGASSPPGLPGWPDRLTAGTYEKVIDLDDPEMYADAFLAMSGGTAAGAEQRLIENLISGNAYFSIHTSAFPSGEIRAFIAPEPATLAVLALGLCALSWTRRPRL
jgi:hypothetical protein